MQRQGGISDAEGISDAVFWERNAVSESRRGAPRRYKDRGVNIDRRQAGLAGYARRRGKRGEESAMRGE